MSPKKLFNKLQKSISCASVKHQVLGLTAFATAFVLALSICVVKPYSHAASESFIKLCGGLNPLECIKKLTADDANFTTNHPDEASALLTEYVNQNISANPATDDVNEDGSEFAKSFSNKVYNFKLDREDILGTKKQSLDDYITILENLKTETQQLIDVIANETNPSDPSLKNKATIYYTDMLNNKITPMVNELKIVKSGMDKFSNVKTIKNVTEEELEMIKKYFGSEQETQMRQTLNLVKMQIPTDINTDAADVAFDEAGLSKIKGFSYTNLGSYTGFPLVRWIDKNGNTHVGASKNEGNCDGPWEVSVTQELHLNLTDIREFNTSGSASNYNWSCVYHGKYSGSAKIEKGDKVSFGVFVRAGDNRSWTKYMDEEGNEQDDMWFSYDPSIDQTLGIFSRGLTLTGDKHTNTAIIGPSQNVKDKIHNMADEKWKSIWKAVVAAVAAAVVSVVAGALTAMTLGAAAPALGAGAAAVIVAVVGAVAGAAASLALTLGNGAQDRNITEVDLSAAKWNKVDSEGNPVYPKDPKTGLFKVSGFEYANNGYYSSKMVIHHKTPGASSEKPVIRTGCDSGWTAQYCRLGKVTPLVLSKDMATEIVAASADPETKIDYDLGNIKAVDLKDGDEVWITADVQAGKDRVTEKGYHFIWDSSVNNLAGYMSQGAVQTGDTILRFPAFGEMQTVVAMMTEYVKAGQELFKSVMINLAITVGVIIVTSVFSGIMAHFSAIRSAASVVAKSAEQNADDFMNSIRDEFGQLIQQSQDKSGANALSFLKEVRGDTTYVTATIGSRSGFTPGLVAKIWQKGMNGLMEYGGALVGRGTNIGPIMATTISTKFSATIMGEAIKAISPGLIGSLMSSFVGVIPAATTQNLIKDSVINDIDGRLKFCDYLGTQDCPVNVPLTEYNLAANIYYAQKYANETSDPAEKDVYIGLRNYSLYHLNLALRDDPYVMSPSGSGQVCDDAGIKYGVGNIYINVPVNCRIAG